MWKRALILFSSTGAVATALVSLLPLVAGRLWLGELASHFRVQYLAAALVLAIVLLALGRARRAALLLPVAALNAFVAVPYLVPQARAVMDGPEVTLMVANLAWRNRHFDGLVEIVARETPDIVVLAEFTEHAEAALAPLEAELPYTRRLARSDPWGIALMSRFPVERARFFELGPTPAVDAELRGPAGTLRVVGVHLVPPTTAALFAARNAQLKALAEIAAAEPGPLIVAGDFNLTPYSPYFASFVQAGGLKDIQPGRGFDFTWPSRFPLLGIPIDHAFVSADLTVLARRRLDRFGSDHLPVLTELFQDENP